MTTVINTLVSENRSVPRLWLEGMKLAHAGIEIGVQYMLNVSKPLQRAELRPAPNGYTGKTFSVSKRTRNGVVSPLLEIRDALLTEVFKVGTKVRVAVHKGRIVICMSHIAQRIQERVSRFLKKLSDKAPLGVVSLFHGGGVLDKAMHSGLQRAGVNSFVQVGVEVESEYLESSLRNNPELWREESIVINGDIRDINLFGADIPQADLLWGGVPCTGASKSGASKNKLAFAEEHSTAGTLFLDFINFAKATNPAVVLLENVQEYAKSIGMTCIRSSLTNLGYELSETILDGAALGSLERRFRLCMVATTPGVCGKINFDDLVAVREREKRIADVLEDVPASSDQWKSYDYLASKELRDKACGKGFMRQLLTGEEDGCGVIGRGYAKGRSTEPFIVAPHDPSLSRLLTPGEHARVKTIPESLIEGLCATTAHEVLGQSVIYSAFEAVGYLLAETVLGLKAPLAPKVTILEAKPVLVEAFKPAQAKLEEIAPATLPLFALTA